MNNAIQGLDMLSSPPRQLPPPERKVTDRGLEEITQIRPDAYMSNMIISKQEFIECYNKWILGKEE